MTVQLLGQKTVGETCAAVILLLTQCSQSLSQVSGLITSEAASLGADVAAVQGEIAAAIADAQAVAARVASIGDQVTAGLPGAESALSQVIASLQSGALLQSLLTANPGPGLLATLTAALADAQAALASAEAKATALAAKALALEARAVALAGASAALLAQVAKIADVRAAGFTAGLYLYRVDAVASAAGGELGAAIGGGLPGGSGPSAVVHGILILTENTNALDALGKIVKVQ